jgi:hypothetical protein
VPILLLRIVADLSAMSALFRLATILLTFVDGVTKKNTILSSDILLHQILLLSAGTKSKIRFQLTMALL